jgi:outer membrane lipoprotein-sorting protein
MSHRGFYWAAALAAGLAVCGQLSADEKGEKVLGEAFKKLHDAKSLEARMTARMPGPAGQSVRLKGTIALMKPNLLRVELTSEEFGATLLFVADGEDYYRVTPQGGTQKDDLDAEPNAFLGVWEGEIDAFFGGEKNLATMNVTWLGSSKVGTTECEKIRAEPKEGVMASTVEYFVGTADRLIYKAVITVPGAEQDGTSQINVLSDIKLDVEKKKEDFKYEP